MWNIKAPWTISLWCFSYFCIKHDVNKMVFRRTWESTTKLISPLTLRVGGIFVGITG